MPTLNWIGKDKVVTHHNDVPYRVLNRQYTFGDTPDSGNMIIRGDNLEALKSLLPQYEGKIKCIYIDPPYNTGNEHWIYNDNVNDPHIKKWLGQVVGSEFDDLTRHDKWLCMMYPRLVLLQRLLSEDGAIFMSIDDNEQANLKMICDEIFGATNFVAQFIWKKKQGGGNDSAFVVAEHEYILCFAKQISNLNFNLDKKYKLDDALYPNHDEKGDYGLITLDKASIQFSQSLVFEIIGPDGTKYVPRIVKGKQACWRWGRKKVEEQYNDLVFKNGKVYTKYYRPEGVTPRSLLIDAVYGRTESGNDDIRALFNNNPFSYPKPVALLHHFISIATKENDIILDSFAGSGTTAHAVLNLNKQDGGNRKFILCEMCDYAETITAERVRRVISGYADTEGTGGSFDFYELGETIFDPVSKNLNDNADTEQIKKYVWFAETNSAYSKPQIDAHPYYLGTYENNNYYFYYKKGEETCLNWDFLNTFTKKDKAEMYIIYADRCLLTAEELIKLNIVFKKIPRDIKRI